MGELFEGKDIRALSWKQPFASLMLHGKIETRTWKTKYRGQVLICASKMPYSGTPLTAITGTRQHDRISNILYKQFNITDLGHAIGIGELVDCRPMTPDDEDACFVKYKPELWCHIYSNVRAIIPFPLKGSQGWIKLNKSIIDQIKYPDK